MTNLETLTTVLTVGAVLTGALLIACLIELIKED